MHTYVHNAMVRPHHCFFKTQFGQILIITFLVSGIYKCKLYVCVNNRYIMLILMVTNSYLN